MLDRGFSELRGPLAVPFSNDYLFHAIVQRSNYALVSLVCALYHIGIDTVRSATLLNPMVLGERVAEANLTPAVRILFFDGTVAKLRLSAADCMGRYATRGEDRLFKTDEWRRMLTAGTWEEVYTLARGNAGILEAAAAAYELLSDEQVCRQCMSLQKRAVL